MSKYSLVAFTPESLADAKAAWEAIAGTDAFDLEFSHLFDWAESHIVAKEHDSQAFNLSNNDAGGRTDAIVDLIDSRKGALWKLLTVVPSPQFWDVNNSRSEIINLYTEVFFRVISSGVLAGAKRTIKLYGRGDDMLSILRSIHSHWAIPNTSADFEGRFLTITINQ